MISIDKIDFELRLITQGSSKGLTRIQKANISKKIQFFKICRAYIETNPDESFILREYNKHLDTITNIENGFWDWHKSGNAPGNMDLQQLKAHYNKINKLADLKSKLETLKYLLGK